MDIPTGNISVSEANRLRKNRKVAEAIPLALGDTYRGFRIVGTETSYIKHYQAELAEGELFTAPMQAVIGARVARETALSAGGTFAGSHGLSGGGEEHADTPYMVVGRLKPTGTVLDRLILTPVESVWQVHGSHDHASRDEHAHKDEHHGHHGHREHQGNHGHQEHHGHHEHESHKEHAHGHADEGHAKHTKVTKATKTTKAAKAAKATKTRGASNEITALLIRVKSRVANISLPRQINRGTSMQAASPAFETARLLSLLGIGLDALKFFGALLMASAVIGMLVAIYQSMQERKYDAALMRVMGASRAMLVKQILIETGLLLALGIITGLLLSHALLAALPMLVSEMRDVGFAAFHFLPVEMSFAAGLFITGLVVALLPALAAYRVDVSRTLAHN